MPRRRPIAPLLLALPALFVGACASSPNTPVVDTLCVPASRVHMATIQRDTSYALVRNPATDTLVLEDTVYGRHGLPERRLTWLVETPADAPEGVALRFGTDDGPIRAWLIESVDGLNTHAIRARGSITIDKRTDNGLQATVVLSASPRPAGPGETVAPAVNVTRRALWRYDTPGLIITPEMTTEEDRAEPTVPDSVRFN